MPELGWVGEAEKHPDADTDQPLDPVPQSQSRLVIWALCSEVSSILKITPSPPPQKALLSLTPHHLSVSLSVSICLSVSLSHIHTSARAHTHTHNFVGLICVPW